MTSHEQTSFEPYGDADTFDSIHLARGLAAVLAFVDPEQPIVQIETYPTGYALIGTDSYSLLRTFVHKASGDGWEATRNQHSRDDLDLDDDPDAIYCPSDVEGVLAKWAAFYGKASRMKGVYVEHVTVQPGKLTTREAVLSDELHPSGIRVAGDAWATQVPDTKLPRDWRKLDRAVSEAKPVDRPIRLNGGRAQTIGKLGALDEDRIVTLQTVVTDGGFEVVTIDVPGSYPRVTGFCAAARPAS